MIRKIWKNASRLVANSEGLKQRALAFEKRYAIDIIENGVDNQFFTPSEKKKKKKPIPPSRCSGLVEYLFQNHTDIISTKPLIVLFQLYFVVPDVRGL